MQKFLFMIIVVGMTCQMPVLAKPERSSTMQLTSSAFLHESAIPAEYTCDGHDQSPPLVWQHAPEGTVSFVLIMDDPDAPMGTWDHWVLFNIPSHLQKLPADLKMLPPGAVEAKNSWGKNQYGGPCPPKGTHRYFFKLYALDITLSLDESVNKAQVEKAMKGHVLAEAVLMGNYQRK